MEFKLVRQPDDANADAVIVTLYRCDKGDIRGWYVGPLLRLTDGGTIPYAPRSDRLLGMVALLRAYEIAERLDLDCYVVDPDNLWDALSKN
jgi:hypothetical protein